MNCPFASSDRKKGSSNPPFQCFLKPHLPRGGWRVDGPPSVDIPCEPERANFKGRKIETYLAFHAGNRLCIQLEQINLGCAG